MSRLIVARGGRPRHAISIVSIKSGTTIGAAILGDPVAIEMHWVDALKRSVPCRSDGECQYCPQKTHWLNFYAIFRVPLNTEPKAAGGAREAILAVPDRALNALSEHVRSGRVAAIRRDNDGNITVSNSYEFNRPLPDEFDVVTVIDQYFFGAARPESLESADDLADHFTIPFPQPEPVQAPGPFRRVANGGGA